MKNIVVLTGVGISAESGIKTFRDGKIGPASIEVPKVVDLIISEKVYE